MRNLSRVNTNLNLKFGESAPGSNRATRRRIVCLLQTGRRIALLDLEILQELRPNNASLLMSLFTNRPVSAPASFGRGLVTEVVVPAWASHSPLPEQTEAVEVDALLRGWSPECTWMVVVYGSPRRELRVKDVQDGTTIASLPLEDADLETGEVYDVAFDSETRFYLKVDGPERHVLPNNRITAGALHDNQGETSGFGRTGNITVHSRCELRMGPRCRVQEDLLDLTRECTEGRWWTFLGRSVACPGRG